MAPAKPTKALTAPDTAVHEQQMNSFKGSIDELTKEVQGIGSKIAEKSTGRKEFQDKKNDMLDKLKEYQTIIDKLNQERGALRTADNDARAKSREQSKSMENEKKKLPYKDTSEIDRKIRDIECRMSTKVMSLKAEKDCLKEISELKVLRPQVAKVLRDAEARAPADITTNQGRIDSLSEQIKEAREAKKKQQEQFAKLLENRKATTTGMDDLFRGRDELNKKITQHIQARQQVRDDFNEKKREWAVHQAEQRSQRQAKQQAESLNRQAEREKRKVQDLAEQEDDSPYCNQIIDYEQAVAYCKSLIKTEEACVEEKKETVHTNPDGYQVMAGKKEREEAMQTKKQKKFRVKNKENKGANSGPIKHNILTIEAFSKLAIEKGQESIYPPNSIEDVPAVLEKLGEKLTKYQGLVKTWESERAERKAQMARTIKEHEEKAEELRKQAAAVLEAHKKSEEEKAAAEAVEA